MSKEDYREKIEEDRQEIELEESKLSRSKLKTKKRKSKLMPTLLVTFIFIPLAVLLYLTFIYEPSSPVEVVEENNDVVQVQKNETPAVPEASEDKQEESEKEQESSSEEPDKLSATEQKAKEEAEKKAKEEEAKRKAEEEKRKAEEEKRKAEEEKKSQKTHTVQSNETLYRIAMKYYNDPNAVAKIKQANGLSSESIYVGQTLVLP